MSKVEQGRTDLETRPLLSPMTIVGAVFAHSGLEKVPTDDQFLQDFFRKSKKNRRYSNLLQDFIFDEVTINPYSSKLDAALARLRLAESVTWTYSGGGGRVPKYRMGQESRDGEIEIALEKDPSEKTQKLLKELGKNFKRAVKKFYVQEEKEIEKSIATAKRQF